MNPLCRPGNRLAEVRFRVQSYTVKGQAAQAARFQAPHPLSCLSPPPPAPSLPWFTPHRPQFLSEQCKRRISPVPAWGGQSGVVSGVRPGWRPCGAGVRGLGTRSDQQSFWGRSGGGVSRHHPAGGLEPEEAPDSSDSSFSWLLLTVTLAWPFTAGGGGAGQRAWGLLEASWQRLAVSRVPEAVHPVRRA